MISQWSGVDFAEKNLRAIFAGDWQAGRPEGITLHYTANDSADLTKREAVQSRVGYHFIVDRAGKVHQTSTLEGRTNHAGQALWNGKSPNRTHISIAVVSWGFTDENGLAWTGKKVDTVVQRQGRFWHACTPLQEDAMLRLVRELMGYFGISAANICGHDECALPAGRKSDPGGVLSYTLEQIRRSLT